MAESKELDLKDIPLIDGDTINILITLFELRMGVEHKIPHENPTLRKCVKLDVQTGREYDNILALRKRKSGEMILTDPDDKISLEMLTRTQKAIERGIRVLQHEIDDEKAKESGRLFFKELERNSGTIASLEKRQEELQAKFKAFLLHLRERLAAITKQLSEEAKNVSK